MSTLKRRRADWEWNVDRPYRQVAHEPKRPNCGNEAQFQWQNGSGSFETVPSMPRSTLSTFPNTNIQFNDSELQEQWQGWYGLENSPYHAEQYMGLSGGQEFDLNLSTPTRFDLNGFEGLSSTIFGDHVLGEPSLSVHETAPTIVNVCYGSLLDVKVQIDEALDIEGLKKQASGSQNISTEPQEFLTMELFFREDYCVIQTKESCVFGILNNRVFRCLTKLTNFRDLKYTALMSWTNWKEKLIPAGKNLKRKCIGLDINISGPQSELDGIARGLSQAELFLQPPPHGTYDLPYDNPQYLQLPGLIQVMDLPISFASQMPNAGNHVGPGGKQGLALNDGYPDFEKLLDELPQHDYLKESVVDIRVLTPLLSHQKTAVDWVIRRETSNSPASRSLWEPESSDNNTKFYQHIITGVKSPVPNDCLGGILADDMGLGKSLAMLCAIMGSLDRASEYAWRKSSIGPTPSKSTLIIVPSALLLDSWIEEIDKHIFRGTLRYCRYHGQERAKDPSILMRYDVVLTTYGTVVADFNRQRRVLESIDWYRLIADEAHVIRNLSTKQFRAVNSITARIRWCLTGTPIQNSLTDLAALVSFLRVPILHEPAMFRKYIDGVSHSSKANVYFDFKNLRLLLSSICLRRGKDILSLFGLRVEERRPLFSTLERQEYNDILHKGRVALDLALSGHNTKETHQRVIEALLRLRMYCNNGMPQQHGRLSPLDSEEILSLLQQSGDVVCRYCSCDILSLGISGNSDFIHMTACRVLICGECIPQYQQTLRKNPEHDKQSCPFCSGNHTLDNLFRQEARKEETEPSQRTTYPSKMMALLNDVQRNPLHEKSIIFSFWKKSLDLIGDMFKANGVRYCRVDGSLSLGKRKTVLAEFQNNSEIGILIMTLGTGAVGLNNLSIASRIYLLEPQWNPSVENQAIGRIFRLGQERPVTVVRYIMEKTIEENVKNKQLRKLSLACGGFDGKGSTQRVQQLQHLRSIVLSS